MTPLTGDPGAHAAAVLEPMLALDLIGWHGLEDLSDGAVAAALGAPESSEETQLGWYPARRSTYRADRPSGGMHCYSRGGRVVLVETLVAPAASALDTLGPPSGRKPHEILVEGAYAHEWVYAPRGLVLTVAEPFDDRDAVRIVRCRGVRPLAGPDDFGPEFHMAFEDRTSWR